MKTDTQASRHTGTQANGQTHRHAETQTIRQADRHARQQTHKQADTVANNGIMEWRNAQSARADASGVKPCKRKPREAIGAKPCKRGTAHARERRQGRAQQARLAV